jgi:hypothetical protein
LCATEVGKTLPENGGDALKAIRVIECSPHNPCRTTPCPGGRDGTLTCHLPARRDFLARAFTYVAFLCPFDARLKGDPEIRQMGIGRLAFSPTAVAI